MIVCIYDVQCAAQSAWYIAQVFAQSQRPEKGESARGEGTVG